MFSALPKTWATDPDRICGHGNCTLMGRTCDMRHHDTGYRHQEFRATRQASASGYEDAVAAVEASCPDAVCKGLFTPPFEIRAQWCTVIIRRAEVVSRLSSTDLVRCAVLFRK